MDEIWWIYLLEYYFFGVISEIFFILSIVTLFSCASNKPVQGENSSSQIDDLLRFAEASCFSWYFKKKQYNDEDIGWIAGGIVELSYYSAEKFRNTALLVRDYKPALETKNDINIDIDLIKCFYLESDAEFLKEIDKIRQGGYQ